MGFGELWRRLAYMINARKEAERLDDEVRLHMELRARRLREEGVSPEDAPYAARREFGNRTRIEETSHELWSWTWLEQLFRDLRYAGRTLRKSPSFSVIAVLSLAVALGSTTSIFSFVRAIVIMHLPVTGADRLVILRQHNEQFHMENCCFSDPFFQRLKKEAVGFEDALAVIPLQVSLTDREQTENVQAEIVSGNYFAMLGVRAAEGRLLDAADGSSEGGGYVCVISNRLWQERFGGSADVIGRRILLNNEPVQIVGVTAPGFTGAGLHEPHDIQVPASITGKLFGNYPVWLGFNQILARLKPGVTPAQAVARLNVVGLQIEKALGQNTSPKDVFFARDGSQGLDSRKSEFGKPVLLLLGLVGTVLLVACANLAALLLVRSVERTSEAGVRLALGGSRATLMRHFLTESMVLAIAGGVASWGFGQVLTAFLLKLLGPQAEGLSQFVRPNPAVFAFSAALTLVAGILFGLLPAWRAAQCDPLLAIRGLVNAVPGGRSLASRVLIAGQIALSLVLLFGAGLFVRTLQNLRSIDVGFKPENVATLRIDLRNTSYAANGTPQFYENLLRSVRELPETRAASLTTISVLTGSMASTLLQEVPAYTGSDHMSYYSVVSNGYFRTLGIPLIAGRDFNSDDRAAPKTEGVAIVNEHFARQYLSGDAIGKAFTMSGGRKLRVVGVVGTARYRWLKEEPQSVMYLPVTQWTFPKSLNLQVRTSGDAAATLERLRALIRRIDPIVPVDEMSTMEMQIDQALARERLLAFLSTLMGGIAVTLAAIGLYGVLSFAVARRTREIGIRMALGAGRETILGQFLAESGWIVGSGLAVGVPLALAAGSLAASLLYGLKSQDILTAVLATVVLCAVAFSAALIPAWRAARLDPMGALRWE
ncbi:MAG TPA: ABC transporter permease [Bryobacteraceae bacterium]|nr:ABC transporter permease [Bryobacteraceae bacterium]